MPPDINPDQTPPPGLRTDTDPLELLAGGTARRALPDDLPGGVDRPPGDGSSVELSELARGESDVLRAVSEKTSGGAGSSNIFDTPLGGSSRFHQPGEATENLPAVGGKRGTDRLLAGLAQPPQPASDLFTEDLFGRGPSASGRFGVPFPRGDSELSTEPPALDPGLGFEALDRSAAGSDLFPDVTESEFELGASEVNIGNPGTGDANPFGGPGSSIFASGALSGRKLTGGDEIPFMASTDDNLTEGLPFDELPAASDIASNIFKGGRGPAAGALPTRPAGLDQSGGHPAPADDDPSPTSRIDWSHAPEEGDDFQISQRMTADDVADLGLPDLNNSALVREAAAAVHIDVVDNVTEPMAPVPAPTPLRSSPTVEMNPWAQPAGRPRKGGDSGWLPGGVLGLVTGVGACAGVYLTGLVPNADKERVAQMVRAETLSATPASIAEAVQRAEQMKANEAALQSARQAADAERSRRTRTEADLTAARRTADATNRQLLASEAQRKAQAQRLAQTDLVAQELAALKATGGPAAKETEAKLQVAQKEAADARAALNGVIAELRKVKLLDATAGPDALGKLPAVLQQAAAALASADGQKSADALRTAEQRAEAARAEASAVKTAAEKAVADSKSQVAELAARLTAQAEDHSRQLADVRAGIVTPLTTAEDRAKADAADGLDRGIDAFFAGRLADAERALATAATRDGTDARIWYYLGLARWKLGNPTGAEEAFRRGAQEETRNRPGRRVLADALSRVQGADRAYLAAYRQ